VETPMDIKDGDADDDDDNDHVGTPQMLLYYSGCHH
jgi:hypothetical protein